MGHPGASGPVTVRAMHPSSRPNDRPPADRMNDTELAAMRARRSYPWAIWTQRVYLVLFLAMFGGAIVNALAFVLNLIPFFVVSVIAYGVSTGLLAHQVQKDLGVRGLRARWRFRLHALGPAIWRDVLLRWRVPPPSEQTIPRR